MNYLRWVVTVGYFIGSLASGEVLERWETRWLQKSYITNKLATHSQPTNQNPGILVTCCQSILVICRDREG